MLFESLFDWNCRVKLCWVVYFLFIIYFVLWTNIYVCAHSNDSDDHYFDLLFWSPESWWSEMSVSCEYWNLLMIWVVISFEFKFNERRKGEVLHILRRWLLLVKHAWATNWPIIGRTNWPIIGHSWNQLSQCLRILCALRPVVCKINEWPTPTAGWKQDEWCARRRAYWRWVHNDWFWGSHHCVHKEWFCGSHDCVLLL